MEVFLEFLSNLAQEILIYLAPLAAAFIVKWIIALANSAWVKFKANKEEEFIALLENIAGMAVRAAEQAKIGELIKDKKAYALEFIDNFLTARGIEIDEQLIWAAVEAAVIEQFGKDK